MVRRRKSESVRTIKQRVGAGAIELTYHAVLEMIDEDISEEDIKTALRVGNLRERQKEEMGGAKYVLRGAGADSRPIEVVCKLIQDSVRVITVYRVESKK